MTTITKNINNVEYKFVNNSYGNHNGFVHTTELFKDGICIGKNKCQYYNRTWERYTYQTVMQGIVYDLLEKCESSYKSLWKLEHNVKRLTEAKRKNMMEDFEKNPPKNYVELKELYSSLS